MRKGKIKNCLICNTEFYVPKYRFKLSKYCSRKCTSISTIKTFNRDCVICGNNFTFKACRSDNAKYCSRKCYYKGMLSKGSVVKNCPGCNSEFRTSPSHDKEYCSWKCRTKHFVKPLHELSAFSNIRSVMRRRNMITKCEECGYNLHPEILGIHHKDENRDNNKISNLMVLCPNCHSLKHHKHTPH